MRNIFTNMKLNSFKFLTLLINQKYQVFFIQFYYDGEIIQQDFQKAKEYFEISSEMNNLDAFFNLGILYTYGRGVPQDYEKARKYYEIAAKHNHYTAINGLGALYLFGFGVEKNYQKAKEYFELAVEHKIMVWHYVTWDSFIFKVLTLNKI